MVVVCCDVVSRSMSAATPTSIGAFIFGGEARNEEEQIFRDVMLQRYLWVSQSRHKDIKISCNVDIATTEPTTYSLSIDGDNGVIMLQIDSFSCTD